MVSIPELDGATGPIVFGGRTEGGEGEGDSVAIEDPGRGQAEIKVWFNCDP